VGHRARGHALFPELARTTEHTYAVRPRELDGLVRIRAVLGERLWLRGTLSQAPRPAALLDGPRAIAAADLMQRIRTVPIRSGKVWPEEGSAFTDLY
jgi:hypothetical protein